MLSLLHWARRPRGLGWIGLFALLATAPAAAAPIVINAFDSGWYDDGGDHFASNENYQVGMRGTEYRNFVVFDLSTIAGATIQSVELWLENPNDVSGPGFDSPDAFETYVLYDVGPTSMSTLTVGGPGGPVGQAVFADLGSGSSYGSVDVTAADNGGIVQIALNQDALDAIALGGVIAFGGAITTHQNDPLIREFAYGWSDETSLRQLVVTVVPEPGTAGLLALGLGVLATRRARRVQPARAAPRA